MFGQKGEAFTVKMSGNRFANPVLDGGGAK
jgi:hypothetical protein